MFALVGRLILPPPELPVRRHLPTQVGMNLVEELKGPRQFGQNDGGITQIHAAHKSFAPKPPSQRSTSAASVDLGG